MYQPLSRTEYEAAINSGLTPEQILVSERQRKAQEVTPAPAKQGLLQKATNIATAISPGGKVGESIGTLAGYAYTKAKDKIQGTNVSQYYDTSAPSPLQVGADVLASGLTVAGFKGVGTTGSFLTRVATMFGIGAGVSGASTIAQGGSAKEAGKNALVGGAVGAALPIAGAGLRAVGRQIQNLPDRFVNSALGRSKAQILKDMSKKGSDSLAQYVIDKKPIGTAKQMIADSSGAVRTLNTNIQLQLQNALRGTGQKITIGTSNMLDDVARSPGAQGALMNRNEVRTVVERLAPQTKRLLSKPSLTLEESNKLRQLLDQTLGDRAFLGVQISNDKEILKTFANILRESVKTKAPPPVRGMFDELAKEIQLRDSLLGVVAQRSKNQVISFGDLIGGGIGGLVGGGVPGAVVGIAGRRVIESVPFKVGAAKILKAVSKVAPIIEDMTPAQQTAILILIAELVSGDENDRESNHQR